MNEDLFEKIHDRNVEQVNHVARTLRAANRGLESMERQRPGVIGGRPDGTMSLDKSVELVTLLQQIEDNDASLRAENAILKDQLATEREAREHLENIIRQVADLIVNGSKGA
jgi:hypothetical protein